MEGLDFVDILQWHKCFDNDNDVSIMSLLIKKAY